MEAFTTNLQLLQAGRLKIRKLKIFDKSRCNEVLVCHPLETITRLWEDAAQGSSCCWKISSRNRLSSLSLCATRINPARLDRRSEFKERIRDNGDSKKTGEKTRREEFAGIVEDEQCATASDRVYEENDDCIIKPRRAGDMPASHNRPWITNEIENEN